MSFRASLSVFLGCQFGQANKLLSAAERGEDIQVKQVLISKPQLAAFTGFHGTTSPLHRAAAAGHLSTCKAIIDLVKSKIIETEEAVNTGKQRSSTLKRWKSLLKTVVDQRSHRGQTPLMLACESGHADIASYLLNEGADALASDLFNCRTALHYAAAGGHAQCIKLLCSDTTFVDVEGTPRLLRDVVTDDLQVHSAKFIDQRSGGGLTALHFAAVSGNLDSLQALLKAGAAIMVKTSSEAFIGQEYLVAGSTPLHIAVIVGSIPLAHALLQAHAEMMTVVSLGRDERHRRPWEGHSRSDIRSVRNAARKLPYHIARDKQWTQMMHLIDPRIPVDAALDAARDTDHGIGPKNLATICSVVLQTSLLQWLDDTETEIEAEKESSVSEDAVQQGVGAASPFAAAVATSEDEQGTASAAATDSSSNEALVTPRAEDGAIPLTTTSVSASATPTGTRTTTTAAVAPLQVTASAPAIPTLSMQSMGSLHTYLGMLCTRRSSPFDSDSPLNKTTGEENNNEEHNSSNLEETSSSTTTTSSTRHQHLHQRSASLAYGDLSRLILTHQQTQAPVPPAAATTGRNGSFTLRSRGLPRASSAGNLMSRSLISPLQLPFPVPTDGTVFVNVRNSVARSTAAAAGDGPGDGGDDEQQGTVAAAGTMRRVLSSFRMKLKSSDGSSSSGADGDSAQDLTSYATAENTTTTARDDGSNDGGVAGGAADGGGSTVHSHASKMGCYDSARGSAIDSSSAASSAASSSAPDDYDDCVGISSGTSCGGSDTECGVCLDNGVQVAFSGCEHALCLPCARNLTKQEKKPPSCPFCRRMVVGFVKVNSSSPIEQR